MALGQRFESGFIMSYQISGQQFAVAVACLGTDSFFLEKEVHKCLQTVRHQAPRNSCAMSLLYSYLLVEWDLVHNFL